MLQYSHVQLLERQNCLPMQGRTYSHRDSVQSNALSCSLLRTERLFSHSAQPHCLRTHLTSQPTRTTCLIRR